MIPGWLAQIVGVVAPGGVVIYAASNRDPFLLSVVIPCVLLVAPVSALLLLLSIQAVHGRFRRATHWFLLAANTFLAMYFWVPFVISISLVT